MRTQYTTNIRLNQAGKRSELGRLCLIVTIDNMPTIFEFTHDDLNHALEQVKANADKFRDDFESNHVQLMFKGELIWRNQLGVTETMIFDQWCQLAGLE